MTTEVKRLEGEAIIIVTWHGEMSPDQMMIASGEVDRLIGGGESEVVRIDDMSDADLGFSSAVLGMAEARSDKPGYPRDPRLKNIIVASDNNTVMKMMVKAAGQDQYGRLRIPMFFSLEEALEVARSGEV